MSWLRSLLQRGTCDAADDGAVWEKGIRPAGRCCVRIPPAAPPPVASAVDPLAVPRDAMWLTQRTVRGGWWYLPPSAAVARPA